MRYTAGGEATANHATTARLRGDESRRSSIHEAGLTGMRRKRIAAVKAETARGRERGGKGRGPKRDFRVGRVRIKRQRDMEKLHRPRKPTSEGVTKLLGEDAKDLKTAAATG